MGRVKARVVIIGGGGTGAAVAYDCALRGYPALLLERGSFTCGTTGRHHGLLHSGARYVVNDNATARECWREARILRRITDGVIEDNGGYMIAIEGLDDPGYAEQFEEGCRRAEIPIAELPAAEVKSVVPAITERIARAYRVPDASFDAWRLPMQFFTSALAQGAHLRQFCEVTEIELQGGAVNAVRYRDYETEREVRVECDIVVNAGGIWAARIADLCNIAIAVNAQKGSMLAVKGRLCNYVLNRLAPAADGDIIVPQRALTIIGTTSYSCDDIDVIESSDGEIDYLLARGDELSPTFSAQPIHAVWAAARPLAGIAGDDPHRASRKTFIRNHAADGAAGFFSVIGGKATTLRAMGEELVDELCRFSGDSALCTSAEAPLLPFQLFYHYYDTAAEREALPWERTSAAAQA